jgi:hypothetical protein
VKRPRGRCLSFDDALRSTPASSAACRRLLDHQHGPLSVVVPKGSPCRRGGKPSESAACRRTKAVPEGPRFGTRGRAPASDSTRATWAANCSDDRVRTVPSAADASSMGLAQRILRRQHRSTKIEVAKNSIIRGDAVNQGCPQGPEADAEARYHRPGSTRGT